MKLFIIMFVKSIGTPSHIIAMVICPGNTPWLFAVEICSSYLPWEFAAAICRGHLPWVCCVYVNKSFFCVSESFFFVNKLFKIESKPFFIWEQNLFWFMIISFLTVFHFVFAVAVMGHRSSPWLFSLQIKLFLWLQSNIKNWMLLQSPKEKNNFERNRRIGRIIFNHRKRWKRALFCNSVNFIIPSNKFSFKETTLWS